MTALAFGPVTGQAAADIILDFEALRHVDNGFQVHGSVYVEDGFRFEARHPLPGNPLHLNTLGTLHFGFPGSTSLYQGVSQGEMVLTRVDGGPFDLASIQLTEHPGGDVNGNAVNLGPFDVTFFGHLAGGGTVTQTFTVDNFLTPKTFTFAGFTDLASVNWFQGPGGRDGPTHQFDNLAVAIVPGPSGLLLFVIGFSGLLWVRGRAGGHDRFPFRRPFKPQAGMPNFIRA